jgi:hypothetical protein
MIAPPGSTYDYTYELNCEGSNWYAIEGVAVYLGAYTYCSTCACSNPSCLTLMAPETQYVPDGGVTWTWSGEAVSGCTAPNPIAGNETCTSTCDGRKCGTLACMPAGEYTAVLCANGANGGSDCAYVPFTYPTSSEVVGVVGQPADAGTHSDGSATAP